MSFSGLEVYQMVVTGCLAAFLANTLLGLHDLSRLSRWRRSSRASGMEGRFAADRQMPLISVAIPARNEADNIGTCVASFQAQSYPHTEILVLNDASEDSTADIVAAIARNDLRVRLIHGAPLPQGWLGKTWACHQLGQAAQGEFLLFTDADTWHHAEILTDALAAAEETGAGLISAWPAQVLKR